jgi:CRISPR-associated protein Csx10
MTTPTSQIQTRRAVAVTLQGPLVTSARVATAAHPEALPFIPGAALWGAVASACYGPGHDKAEVFERLHGGALVIGDGWPATSGRVGLPVPMSLHLPKGQRFSASAARDWTVDAGAAGWAQCKRWAIGPELTEVPVQRNVSLRTAISPETGRADDGQLFGIEALAPGQCFIAMIAGEEVAVETAVAALGATRYLGRSRHSEFGRVEITETSMPVLPDTGAGPARYLWCLSDLAAHDTHGQPTTRPGPAFFGQPIDWGRAFIRRRLWSPFNSTWGTRAPERLVIERGSVLVLDQGIAPGLHPFGFHQEQGLGQVLALTEPPLAALRGWAVGPVTSAATKGAATAGETDLSRLLAARAGERATARVEAASTEVAVGDWMRLYALADRIAGRRVGPSPSQWGAVASSADPVGVIESFLSTETNAEADAWLARIGTKESGTFAAKALAEVQARAADDQGSRARWLRVFARDMRRALDKARWFDAR